MARRRQADRAEEFISKLPDNFLNCRRFGHSWRHDTAQRYRRTFVQTLRCRECQAGRIETIDSSGQVLSRQPLYPPGYLAKGLGSSVRAAKGQMRLEVLNRSGWEEAA